MTTSRWRTQDGWTYGKRTQENGLWIHLDRHQVDRNRNRVDRDLSTYGFNAGTRGWLILTQRGVVFVETWKPNADCPDYIGFHMWIGPCRYWQRIHDTFANDEERRAAAHSFAETVVAKLAKCNFSGIASDAAALPAE
jgi:hypothetical protein